MAQRKIIRNLLWALMGAVVLTAVTIGMFRARSWALANLSTPNEQARWEEFRQDMARQDGSEGPVKRRPPKSPEPPALVLLRDYFPVSLAGAVFFSSLLFAVTMILLRGIFSSLPNPTKPDPVPSPREIRS